ADNELVFVSGHPGRTSRLLTMAELEYTRDRQLPFRMRQLNRLEVLYNAYSARSEENARRAKEDLFSVQNSRKAFIGRLGGLLDPALMTKKKSEEEVLRQAVARDSKLKETSAAWEKIAQAQEVIAANALDYNLLEAGAAFNSQLFGIARTLLRAGEEFPKPNGERLREFVESSRESLEFQLFSEEPIYDDFEILKLANSLTFLIELKGYKSPLVQTILAGKSPDQRASQLIQGTKVKDVELRRKLYKQGKTALEAAKDPLIELAQLIDAEARALRKAIETQSEVKQQAHAQIGKARFAIQGTSAYPDATFTLRLAYGQMKGYEESGRHVPFQTTFAGLYERAAEQKFRPPFDLPESWVRHKPNLDLSTPYNFVNTADIIGGNSGSPVINKNAEVVGLIFDGNIQSLVLDYVYTDEVARAVSVHSRSIPEALRKVYDAPDLAGELTGRN
ncbi:MAG: S46 family peptidase, partial [Verrucomicrobiales bacterium]|nr:S46 family peptidase [Verrucomicrobiales bacterium]